MTNPSKVNDSDKPVAVKNNTGGGELFIVDNSDENWKGLRYLEEWTDVAKQFDIATGFFEIGSLLALDEPQLSFKSFDLSILEFYRNDPRYVYDCDDISGRISVTNKHYQSSDMRKVDQVYLQTFGFSFNQKMNRAVAVFLRYLHDLSPEHQQIWKAKMLSDEYKMHPDYWESSMGRWPEGASIFDAFIEEMQIINDMSKLMNRPPFFKDTYKESSRPRHFGFLIRPTLKEFNEFVHLLDKMISENINLDFFQNEISFYDQKQIIGRQIGRQRKGSLTVLSDWLDASVAFPDREPKEQMIEDFRVIRKLRQKPAHLVQEDDFDQKYLEEQRQLLSDAFGSLRALRKLFHFHSDVKNYEIPVWLEKSKIRLF